MSADHEVIWLSPDCGGCERTWCQDPVYETCPDCGAAPVKYVRADLVPAPSATEAHQP